ncbi:unnamed protein product [Malus baccata var. baccata]|uniref:DUF3511 domain-containing protein n=1 Tax=Malus domestica TaxID=3750 RepID=A0A498J4M5_MALDO|nr:uncharacterized protein LOC126581915 [Malus sylvestris]RXH88802.1 hypothetical protein DVH24_000401 [Malus domestica]
MEDFRSKSCRDGRDGRMQMDVYYGGKPGAPPTSMQDLRSYSSNYAGSCVSQPNSHQMVVKDGKLKKGKGSLSASKSWSLSDPELQRKKRVAGYKVYTAEEKMKGSLRKSFKWIKNTYTQVVYGWR